MSRFDISKILQRAAQTGPVVAGAAALAGAGYLATNALYTAPWAAASERGTFFEELIAHL